MLKPATCIDPMRAAVSLGKYTLASAPKFKLTLRESTHSEEGKYTGQVAISTDRNTDPLESPNRCGKVGIAIASGRDMSYCHRDSNRDTVTRKKRGRIVVRDGFALRARPIPSSDSEHAIRHVHSRNHSNSVCCIGPRCDWPTIGAACWRLVQPSELLQLLHQPLRAYNL